MVLYSSNRKLHLKQYKIKRKIRLQNYAL